MNCGYHMWTTEFWPCANRYHRVECKRPAKMLLAITLREVHLVRWNKCENEPSKPIWFGLSRLRLGFITDKSLLFFALLAHMLWLHSLWIAQGIGAHMTALYMSLVLFTCQWEIWRKQCKHDKLHTNTGKLSFYSPDARLFRINE